MSEPMSLTQALLQRAEDARVTGATRRMARLAKKAAYVELTAASNGQVVLAHVHPRWLREVVAYALDHGGTVNQESLDDLRQIGLERAWVVAKSHG